MENLSTTSSSSVTFGSENFSLFNEKNSKKIQQDRNGGPARVNQENQDFKVAQKILKENQKILDNRQSFTFGGNENSLEDFIDPNGSVSLKQEVQRPTIHSPSNPGLKEKKKQRHPAFLDSSDSSEEKKGKKSNKKRWSADLTGWRRRETAKNRQPANPPPPILTPRGTSSRRSDPPSTKKPPGAFYEALDELVPVSLDEEFLSVPSPSASKVEKKNEKSGESPLSRFEARAAIQRNEDRLQEKYKTFSRIEEPLSPRKQKKREQRELMIMLGRLSKEVVPDRRTNLRVNGKKYALGRFTPREVENLKKGRVPFLDKGAFRQCVLDNYPYVLQDLEQEVQALVAREKRLVKETLLNVRKREKTLRESERENEVAIINNGKTYSLGRFNDKELKELKEGKVPLDKGEFRKWMKECYPYAFQDLENKKKDKD